MSKLLELQRASAGSGKTFTLAKKFLWYFLTIRTAGDKRRLRTNAELNDSLSHILAVTFTNKATNEMQQRIVEKLYDLAYPEKYLARNSSGRLPDYLDEFCKDLNVTQDELSRLCRKALSILLNNYSDFQVSTIDSFFQLVLRTFAYESDLNDSYQIELDSEFLRKVGIDSTLEDINNEKASSEVSYWIDELMKRSRMKGEKWNIFQKKEKRSSYELLLSALKKLETEDFKQIRDELENYFKNNPDFILLYERLTDKYAPLPKKAFDDLKSKAQLLISKLEPFEDSHNSRKHLGRMYGHANKVLACRYDKKPEKAFTVIPDDFFQEDNSKFTGILKAYPDLDKNIGEYYIDFSKSLENWEKVLDSRVYRNWLLYSENFPYLGLLNIVLKKRKEYLEENNAVELAETNSILNRIIGDDDTPFIYERLGTRLNHFLIDEFQDTSKLQWLNLRPLISESLSRGNEDLIIGDAKQSIYRFRNADPSLITHTVPGTFPDLTMKGNSIAENTNWRSDKRIVRFNNEFFYFLSSKITDPVSVEPGRINFMELYSNVRQASNKTSEAGYVEVNLIKKSPKGRGGEDEAFDFSPLAPGIVNELRSRGFRMRDIAFLVSFNDQGESIIESFTAYNASLAADDPNKIEFISEQSLKLSSSVGVNLIVTSLETINRGIDPQIRSGLEANYKGRADWTDIKYNFSMFALRHPGLSTPDLLEAFLQKGSDFDAIREMLADMQSVSLPALVEAISATFLPEDMLHTDAAYLAAFQDIVLEYCESHPTDIASFLEWWNRKKNSVSIASPEETDAVRVMTIHKSKGLEFPCVIIPFADGMFSPKNVKHPEWRWVKPDLIEAEGFAMPPFLPVDTTSSLENTSHESLLYEYRDMRDMDLLNSLYVGFTRAEKELYIYSSVSTRPSGAPVYEYLDEFFKQAVAMAEDMAIEEHSMPDISRLQGVEECRQWTVGRKYEYGAISSAVEQSPSVIIDSYIARQTPEYIKYKETDVPDVVDGEDLTEEDSDPRSEGNLFHAIMENVVTESDIDSSARKLAIKGLVSTQKSQEMVAFIKEHLERSGVEEWFNGSYRVLNERSLIKGGLQPIRADRIMIDKKGNAIVVDYKFGKEEKPKKYSNQLYEYMERLKATGIFKSVKGYLWYVSLDRLYAFG